jgi:hypothetical protein
MTPSYGIIKITRTRTRTPTPTTTPPPPPTTNHQPTTTGRHFHFNKKCSAAFPISVYAFLRFSSVSILEIADANTLPTV